MAAKLGFEKVIKVIIQWNVAKNKNVDVDQKWTGDEVVITHVCLVGHYSRVISIISKASKEGELELLLLLRWSQHLTYLSWVGTWN